jgi:hypothetical protein
MALHHKKTKFIIFNSNEQVLSNANVEIFINSNIDEENFENLKIAIERITINSDVPAIKFLGVFLYPKLNFKYNVLHITSKISQSLYIIQAAKHFLSNKALKSLFYAIIHSHLIYCIFGVRHLLVL